MKTALFPGSFDPVTLGHEDIARRALQLFDRVIIAIGNNASKKYMFPLEKRRQWIESCFDGVTGVKVMTYDGLTVDFCKKTGAAYIVRGLRNASDFQFEQVIAQMNQAMAADVETVFIPSRPELVAVNSTVVRDIIRHGGDISPFVPKAVKV